MTASVEAETGMNILKRMTKSLAPSIFADSSRLAGTCWKLVLMTIRFQVPIKTGSMTAQRVLYNPRFLTRRKLGIRPPEKYMVNTMSRVIAFLNMKDFRDNA
jgi:hypothetical protein